MATTILRPNGDVQTGGWHSNYKITARTVSDTHTFINEADQDKDESYIHTIDPVTSTSRPTYTCRLDNFGPHYVTEAIATVWAKGPTNPTVATSVAEGEEDEGNYSVLCHAVLLVRVTSDEEGLDVMGHGKKALDRNEYKDLNFKCTIPPTHNGPVFMHFYPALSGGNGERYCRITQAQIKVTH
ncbi:hypothetical protein [Lignipirellula cremea]|uniref:Uncharacterized protein n=1 Tax=Lignipirellula cremea TaxID=2528010 RepID=A0A518DYL7_9BACT|nr:hypothetical protein [Lignipirellula cremea]QDU96936.1 hypothetical protein Pla8534_47590 [Lignipirellula cremea]